MPDPQQQPFTLITGGVRSDELERLRAEIEARNRLSTAVAELGQAALTGVDSYILMGQACALVEMALGMSHCRALEQTASGQMVVRAAIGPDGSFANCTHDEEEDDSIGMFVLVSDEPVTFSTSDDETRFKCSHLRDDHHIRNGVGVAIHNQYGRNGVLLAYVTEERSLRDFEIEFLRSTASILGEALARDRVEAALRRSESRLRQLIGSALDAVVTIDRNGIVAEWNPQAEETFGLQARQVIGGPLPASIFAKREYRMLDRLLVRARQNARPTPLRRRNETIARRADGQPFPAEVTIESIGSGADQVFTFFIRDISEQKRAQKDLEMSERRFRTMFEKSWSGVALLDENLRFSFAGSSTPNILGYRENDLVGRDLLSFVHPHEREPAARMFADIGRCPNSDAHGELRFRHLNGTWVWIEGFAQNMLHEPSVGAIILNFRDVTQRRMTEKQLEYRAHYDPLTDLPNRVLFRDRVVNGLAQAHRHHSGLAIMYLDLDHFKLVNDALGHAFGDGLLAVVARRLQNCLRASDTISRIGGDEFSILINDISGADSVGHIARKLLESFNEPFRIEQHDLYVTASIGISLYPTDGEDAETLVKSADAAMYRAKELGRHQAQLFTTSMNERYVRRLNIEQDLHQAIERDEFYLLYQPIYDSARQIAAIEAFIRWNHPDRGIVEPAEFIPLAEETGLILPIGEWVLRQACTQMRTWAAMMPADARVSVNVSAHELQQSDYSHGVQRVLDETGLPPQRLQLEITESAAMESVERTMRTLRELRAMGVSVAVDDFGTGRSSLIYLRQFPIDAIKMDEPFLREISDDDTAIAVASYIIGVAHALRLKVVAEGVESQEQYEVLRRFACDQMQGIFFAKPLAADATTEFLRRQAVVVSVPPEPRLPGPPPRADV
jgi:diguanylate cyclase (GGDEF)-like protein/PAS domain S-box-containing protein